VSFGGNFQLGLRCSVSADDTEPVVAKRLRQIVLLN
jgi:hypothetical protein